VQQRHGGGDGEGERERRHERPDEPEGGRDIDPQVRVQAAKSRMAQHRRIIGHRAAWR
jgi:hypothetical protein